MKLDLDIRPQGRGDGFYAELELPATTVVGVTVVGMGDTVADTVADLARQLRGASIDELLRG